MALTAAWLLVSLSMFFYFFNILDSQNLKTQKLMASDRSSLLVLQQEDQSFKDAQADLNKMATQPYQPDNFFSKDIALVDEIQTLEDLSAKYNLQMTISGVSGTAAAAPLAQTATPIALVPYGLSLTGTLPDLVDFMENLENLQFVTTITTVSINSGDKGQVNANLAGDFYLRK